MRKLRLGIIGCGWFASFHVRALQRLSEQVEVVWVADPQIERARQIAERIGAPRCLADYREGLPAIDAADIIVPHHLHHEITLDCLNSGLHVLLEKPLATTLSHADAMIAAAQAAGVVLMVGYPHRYRNSMRLFKRLIECGTYGKLFMLDGLMDESLQGHSSLGWLSERKTLGGGVFFSSSPHMLDVMLWIAGDIHDLCMVGTRAGVRMEGEDTAASIIKFKSGVIGVTRHTWASPRSRIWYTLTATCDKASLTLTTTPAGDLVAEGDRCPWRTRITALGAGDEVLLDSDEGLDLLPEFEHFLTCVRSGAVPETDARVARRMMELTLSAYGESARRGMNV